MDTALPPPPDWGRATTTLVPGLTWGAECELLPPEILSADVVVLVLLDSLGWHQLATRRHIAPVLDALEGGPGTTVAPSTTAAALTSISTGVPPGEHGIVGYRFPAGGAVMNALRWTSAEGDHRRISSPSSLQLLPPMVGGPWTVVSGRQFVDSGFTEAHLGATPYVGYQHPSSIVSEVRGLIDGGAKRIYAYYDGLDHIAHIHGVGGDHFDRELAFCDWLVGQLIGVLPSGTGIVVTGDHGQIDAPALIQLDDALEPMVVTLSGEPRFRWVHCRPGAATDLLEAATACHGDRGWVRSKEELIAAGWFGPTVTDAARGRLGDVALIARDAIGFDDPAEIHANRLTGRHGSVTDAEMAVPVLWLVT